MMISFRSIRDFLLLLLWGFFVLWMDLSKQLSTYLHPSLQPYTIAAGMVLILLACFSLRSLLKGNHEEAGCCHHEEHDCCHGQQSHTQEEHDHHHPHDDHEADEECGHHHGAGAGSVSLLFKTVMLLLPLAVVALGQNNHYTMSTIANRGVVQDLSKLPSAKAAPIPVAGPAPSSSTDQSSSDQSSTNAAGSMPIQVIDLLYAVQMPTYREEFEGKQVELIGQFVPLTTGNPKGDRFQVIRLFITCCAADAKPVGVTVQYDKPLKVSEMGWVKITGTPTFPMEGGRRTAVLVAKKVEECPAPDEPFVY